LNGIHGYDSRVTDKVLEQAVAFDPAALRPRLGLGITFVRLGRFDDARATATYIRQRNPATLSLVAMGSRASVPAPEDERCADYLESLLTGQPYDHVAALAEILAHHNARKYLDANNPHLPKEDIILCLQRDLVDFALRAEQRDDMIEAVPVRVDRDG